MPRRSIPPKERFATALRVRRKTRSTLTGSRSTVLFRSESRRVQALPTTRLETPSREFLQPAESLRETSRRCDVPLTNLLPANTPIVSIVLTVGEFPLFGPKLVIP